MACIGECAYFCDALRLICWVLFLDFGFTWDVHVLALSRSGRFGANVGRVSVRGSSSVLTVRRVFSRLNIWAKCPEYTNLYQDPAPSQSCASSDFPDRFIRSRSIHQ